MTVLFRASTVWRLFLFILLEIIFSILVPVPAHSDSIKDVDVARLGREPAWLRLLHFDDNAFQSTILDSNFFLSSRGRQDPLAEMMALLEAAETPVRTEGHPRCRFPARYFWLGNRLSRPSLRIIPSQCHRLHGWLKKNYADSISLLLVGGYFGNPASLFGHAILKLNAQNGESNLFDATLNYGALVPPKEPIFLYITKGLFGGYTAGYSDRYFYTQDVVYTHTEARDIWEYELNLSKDQIYFVLLHIWEIVGKKKRYYFLTRNCAYELSRVVSIGLGENLSEPPRLWYVPVDMFNQLQNKSKQRKKNGLYPFVRRVIYHPSVERVLVSMYNQLDPLLKRKADAFMLDAGKSPIDVVMQGLDIKQKIKLLDFLFSYQHFIYIKEMPNPPPEISDLKNKLLVQRLKLPPTVSKDSVIAERPSPAAGAQPLVFAAGAMLQHSKNSLLLNLTFFSRESTGLNSLNGDELTVFDIVASAGGNNLTLEYVDYLRILHHATQPFPTEQRWSWRTQLRTIKTKLKKYDHQFYFGVGKSVQQGDMLFYGLLTPSLHSEKPIVRFRPELGIIFPLNSRLKGQFVVGYENQREGWRWVGTSRINFNLNRRFSVMLDYFNEDSKSFMLKVRSHW